MDALDLDEVFLDENYSIETLLAKTQEATLNLGELRDRLIQHQQHLSQTSLELFNNNYDRFYKLSCIISCLAEPIGRLTGPLNGFKDQLFDVWENHNAYISSINTKLEMLEETNKNRDLAVQLISYIKRYERLDKRMITIDWSVKSTSKKDYSPADFAQLDIDYKVKCDLLERVNVELYFLTCEVSAMRPTHDELIPIKKSLETHLSDKQSQLDNWFESSFLSAIELQDKWLIGLILRTYIQKEGTGKLDLVWRNKVVKPYLDITFTETAMSRKIDDTNQVYELLEQFLRRNLELIEADFVIRSFWHEIVNSLDKLVDFYSLTNLDTFHRRYISTRVFLERQRHYSRSDNIEHGLSQSEIETNVSKIMKKFNLKSYFNHRLSQVASGVESSLIQQPLSEMPCVNDNKNSEPAPVQFKLKICMHIYALVTKCWSAEIFIDDLETSFTQLACRILNRFADWLSKLRLSDFRITGPTAPENNRQTNFLAKQDAIMRLLIEDCNKLIDLIGAFLTTLPQETNLSDFRKEMISESFGVLRRGLENVQSLQRLIER